MYFLNPSVTVGMMNNLEWTGNAINVYAEATLCHFDISGSTGMGGGLPLSFLERGLLGCMGHVNFFGCMGFCFYPEFEFLCQQHVRSYKFLCTALHYMGARERGRIAASAPLALRPVPVATAQLSWCRVLVIFSSGFLSACSAIWWILFGLVYVD